MVMGAKGLCRGRALFRQAADQGDGYAQYNLGLIYSLGDGVPKDNVQTYSWFIMTAEQGNAGAQYNLGVMYDQGKGVPEDVNEVVHWYRLATEQEFGGITQNLSPFLRAASSRRGMNGSSAACCAGACACRRSASRMWSSMVSMSG